MRIYRRCSMHPILANLCSTLLCILGLVSVTSLPAAAQAPPPIELRVVGGLASLRQYVRYEAPFWSERVPALTGGRVHAEIAPFDGSGIRGQEMLQLMRLGVVPFGTVLLALAAADEPELNAVDLPMLSPDIASLRQTVQLWRPRLTLLLRERYGIDLLAIYTYPAQVVFCRGAFASLRDLAGRRVRVSSVGQSELMASLGAIPVVMPFAEVVPAIRAGGVQCAITGTLSGNAIGLQTVTTHISPVAITWGVAIFGANHAAWMALPPSVREALAAGLNTLQEEIWQGADQETSNGLACNAGRPDCVVGVPGRMTIVEDSAQDHAFRQRFLTDAVLPAWVERCGTDCVEAWNHTMAPALGIRAREN